jgi:hypothetical protein
LLQAAQGRAASRFEKKISTQKGSIFFSKTLTIFPQKIAREVGEKGKKLLAVIQRFFIFENGFKR